MAAKRQTVTTSFPKVVIVEDYHELDRWAQVLETTLGTCVYAVEVGSTFSCPEFTDVPNCDVRVDPGTSGFVGVLYQLHGLRTGATDK